MRGGGRAALLGRVEDAWAERARGSCAGAAKGGGGDARGHIPSLPRRGSAFRPSPRCQHASAPEMRPGGLRRPRGSRKSFTASPRPRLQVRTAFPVSRETMLHVGSTSGRGDVTAYAVRQRRAGLPRHAPGPTRPAEAGKLTTGLGGEGLFYAESCEREGRGAKGKAGESGLEYL